MGRHSKFEEKRGFNHPPYGGYGVPIPFYEVSGEEAAHLYRAAALVFESLPPTPLLLQGIQAIEVWKQEHLPWTAGSVAYHGLQGAEVEGEILHLITDGGRKVSVRIGATQVEWCRVDFRRSGSPTGSTVAATEVAARFHWVRGLSADLARLRLSVETYPEGARVLGVTPESLDWDV